MRKLEPIQLKPWMLPLIVLALAVPIVAAFALGGPPAGLAVGAIAATVILILAARARFDEPIEVGVSPPDRYLMLVVLAAAIEEPGLAGAVAEIARAGASVADPEPRPEILLLAPAVNTRMAHWLSDLRRARFEAQRRLTLSLASLAGAGLDARGQVGDSDTVQAVEDTLRTFPAQEVVFVTGPGASKAVSEVRRRLDRPVRTLTAAPARAVERGRST